MKLIEDNWLMILIFQFAIILLVLFVVKSNLKDKLRLEKELNNDYPKRKAEQLDIELEEPMK